MRKRTLEMLDLVIRKGLVVDGTGRPGFRADVAIKDGRIVQVGEVESSAVRALDAEGCVVAPGFIDIHSHTDETVLANPTCESKVTQGVTFELCGNCGDSAAPRGGEHDLSEYSNWLADLGIEPTWSSTREFLDKLDAAPKAINFATLVGHGTVRTTVAGYENRPPTADELAEMCRLVEEAMDAGAFGLSSGLVYPPGCYAQVEELVELSRVAARHDGIYATHMRNEGGTLLEALEEALRIGRESGAGVQISHHKACGRSNWGKVKESLAMIDAARAEGSDVCADQYPYVATCAGLGVMLPKWAHDGGNRALLNRLSDAGERLKIREALLHDTALGWISDLGGWESVVVSSVRQEQNLFCEGLSVAEIAKRLEKHPVDAAMDLLLDEKGSVGMMHFVINEEDVRTVMKHPAVLIGSDATARALEGPLARGKAHPRAFGTFARVLGRYVRAEKLLGLEEGVAKMTGLAARRISLGDRGTIAQGNWADVTVFDPNEIADTATFTRPYGTADGIRFVIVNGRIVLEEGALTGAMPGRVVRHSRRNLDSTL